MFKGKFIDIVAKDDGFLRGPFGSALKKSLFVPKENDTYKVYEQSVVLEQNKNLGDYYITKEYFEKNLNKFEVKEGDFLVSCSGVNYGAIYQLNGEIEKGVINQALLRIRINKEIVDENYFLYYFRSYIVKVITSGTGDSTIPNFPPMSVVKNIKVELPELDEQRKIGRILKLIDSEIENNINIISQIEKMTKTIYDYYFLQFDFPNENGKPYKAYNGEMIWNNLLKREIPAGWEVKKVSDILNVVTGKKDANFATENGKYKFFTCSNEVSRCEEYEYNGKAVLIAGNGDFNVKYFDGKFNAYQRTYVLMPKEEKYIGLIYHSAIRKINSFKRAANGSIVKFITKGDIDNIEILIPNDEKIINILNTNLNMIQHFRNKNEEIESLKKFLLPLLMNGKIKL